MQCWVCDISDGKMGEQSEDTMTITITLLTRYGQLTGHVCHCLSILSAQRIHIPKRLNRLIASDSNNNIYHYSQINMTAAT